MNTIQFDNLVLASSLQGDSPEDTDLLKELYRRAESFIKSFAWCRSVTKAYFGFGVGKIVGVFLFRIEPASPEIDEYLWVVVGDLPPAYLVTDQSPTPKAALRAYISEMKQWIIAVRENKSMAEIIPVNVEPTSENADRLDSRLDFLQKEFLSSR